EEEEEELQPAPQKSALPEGWALALMIMGGVLLLVAAVVLCLFLFRAPRVPAKEEEESPAVAPAPAPVAVPVKEPEETTEQEADEESAEQPVEPTEEPADTAPKSVSLEDLFR
ncbi:MAG: hypothetical protein J6R77_06725, partial [Clostridia bacterium]|nr:hypothetical protein [Clostridia bacterium]